MGKNNEQRGASWKESHKWPGGIEVFLCHLLSVESNLDDKETVPHIGENGIDQRAPEQCVSRMCCERNSQGPLVGMLSSSASMKINMVIPQKH